MTTGCPYNKRDAPAFLHFFFFFLVKNSATTMFLLRHELARALWVLPLRAIRRPFSTGVPLLKAAPPRPPPLHHPLRPQPGRTPIELHQHLARAKELLAKTQAYQHALQTTTKKNLETILPKHENIYTVPNLLTATRIATAPVIGYLLCHNQTAWAMSLFVYSCVTDFVDGYLARRYKMGSVLGSIIDPMADKLLMTVCTLLLCYNSTMPLFVASIIIGRDVMLGVMAVYYRFVSLPPPRTFLRYWDFLIPSASVHPTRLSKWNTGLQMVYIGTLVMKPAVELVLGDAGWVEGFHWFLAAFEYLVATTTVVSGGTYLFSKDAVKFVR